MSFSISTRPRQRWASCGDDCRTSCAGSGGLGRSVEGQAGAGEATVDQVRTVLDLLQSTLDGSGDLPEVGGGEITDVALDQGPDALLRVEVRCVGGQLEHGGPVVIGRVSLHSCGEVDVEVVPDQDDRATELDVCTDGEVAVVGPGEALAGAFEWEVEAGSVDHPALLAGFVAAQRGHRDPAPGAAADADDGRVPAPAPVRARGGVIANPGSSSKTSQAPSAAAMLLPAATLPRKRGYPHLLPQLHARSSRSSARRAGPARTSRAASATATPSRSTVASEPAIDDRLDQCQGPSLVLETVGGRALCQLLLQFGELGRRQLRHARRTRRTQSLGSDAAREAVRARQRAGHFARDGRATKDLHNSAPIGPSRSTPDGRCHSPV